MSFVVYDVETTGLSKGFDQIVQFAAVQTAPDLTVTDRYQIRCRLMSHVIPSAEALHVMGLRINELIDPTRPSHLQMVTNIRRTLESWRPAVFLGFNSLSFDEEFLRHAFYQSLYYPYLTNTKGNARADVLNLCRVAAAIRPDVLRLAVDEKGRTVFKLKALAEANGISVPLSHDAMTDVETTLALCKLIQTGAPEVWSQFLRFSQKASVESFLESEEAFIFSETNGNRHHARVVTPIGSHSEQSHRHYCLDLSVNINELRAMSDEALIASCREGTHPVVIIRSNAAPILWALYDAPAEHIKSLDEAKVLEQVEQLKDDVPFLERLCKAAQAADPSYPPSPYVEEQIYGCGFPPREDDDLMLRFHECPWANRVELTQKFRDDRYRQLGRRLIYLENPESLDAGLRSTFDSKFHERLLSPAGLDVPWRSIPAARRGVKGLIAAGLDGDSLERQLAYLDYLNMREEQLALAVSS